MSLLNHYQTTISKQLQKDLAFSNVSLIPKLEKIVVNVGVGEASMNKNAVQAVVEDIKIITGQQPLICKARKSVSAFKIRKGLPIGVKVTLRGQRAYDFLEKLISIVLPRIRDFKGLSSKAFDGMGNLNIGLSDQTLFPEIEYDKIDKVRGLEITIVTSAKSDSAAKALLEAFKMPFID
ncbi:MAG: 50S ribosomal protein L5 [Microgenomates bacterium OLB22]|nr:MAG: 50S ribosomal protein L5 [Microgenomates bacterium OLB22]